MTLTWHLNARLYSIMLWYIDVQAQARRMGPRRQQASVSILVPPSPCHLPPLHLIKRIFLNTWEKSRDIAIYVNKFPSIKHKPARYGIIKRLINVSLTFFHFRYFCVRFLGVSWQMKDKKTSIHHSGLPVIDGIKLSLPILNIGSPIHKTSA